MSAPSPTHRTHAHAHPPPSSDPPYPSAYRERAPSLGELHQELENEQEAQVNRLLGIIRDQAAQITTLQAAAPRDDDFSQPTPSSTSAARSRTPSSSRASSTAPTHVQGSITAAGLARDDAGILGIAQRGESHHSPLATSVTTANATNGVNGDVHALGYETLRRENDILKCENETMQRELQRLQRRVDELEHYSLTLEMQLPSTRS